jgi:hypothetical protein
MNLIRATSIVLTVAELDILFPPSVSYYEKRERTLRSWLK